MSPEVEALLAEQPWVQKLARALVRDSSLADDFAQEAMLAAVRRGEPGRAEGSGALRAFLAGVLRNLQRARKRADAGRERREALAAEPEVLPSPADLLERAEMHRLLVESVLALAEQERTAILLRYFEELSAEEIARRSGEPSATIRARIHRGLERLRERLERRLPREDLFAGLIVLARAPLGPTAAAAAGSAVPLLGGMLVMKTVLTLIAACAVLGSLAVGFWFSNREEGGTRKPLAQAGAPGTEARIVPVPGAPASEPEPEATTRLPVATEERADAASSTLDAARLAPRIDARVVDERGSAIAGAAVLQGETRLGESGPAGDVAFSLAPLEQETIVTLEFLHPRFARREVGVRVALREEIHLGEVTLVAAGAISGWVEDGFGRRLGGARVVAAGLENPRTDPEELRRQGPELDRSTIPVDCAGDGSFHVEGVPAGSARVWAGAEGMAWSSLAPVEVVAGETLRGVRLIVAELRDDDRITGFVLDPEGNPVAKARVQYWFTAATYGRGGAEETDGEGCFEILLRQRVAHDLTVSDPQNRWSEIYAPGVEPGARELELSFESARWIEVGVSDEGGKPLESFELEPLGCVSSDGRWFDMQPYMEPVREGRSRVHVPNARFEIQASAYGYESEKQGPFEPASAPASLSFELAQLPGIRGRVVGDEQRAVAGAKVGLRRTLEDTITMIRDGFRVLVDPYRDIETTSDDEGRFTLYPDAAAEFVVHAEAEGYALTVVGPRRFDPQEGVELEIQLVHGGAIEGEALVPPGLDPTGFVIAYHRGDGKISTFRLGSDGRYRLEKLTPGPWELRPLGRELEPQRSTTSSTYHEGGGAPPMEDWSCEVFDGETTRHDVDLSGFAPCEVAGLLALEGRSLAGWTAALERRARILNVEVVASAPLAAGGAFRLAAPRAGEYALVLRAPEEAHGRLELSENLELSPGSIDWRLVLRPGRLEGSLAPGKGTRERFYSYNWTASKDGHALTGTVRIVPDAGGRFVLATVPEGPGTITRNDPPAEGQRFGKWETVAEFELAPGGLQRIAIP